MALTLLLPGAPSQRPDKARNQSQLQLTKTTTQAELDQLHPPLTGLVSEIIAGVHSPPALVARAHQLWPDSHLYQHRGGTLWDHTAPQPSEPDALPQPAAAKPSTAPALTVPPDIATPAPAAAVTHTPARPPSEPTTANTATLNKLIFDIYCYHCWGAHQNQAMINQHLQALQQLGISADDKVDQAIEEGNTAYDLIKHLQARSDQGETHQELKQWINQLTTVHSKRIIKSLQLKLDSMERFQQSKRTLARQNRNFQISSQRVQVDRQGHPCALSQLAPATKWTLLIDETGNHFDPSVRELRQSDNRVGKMVALVLAQPCTLPKLAPGFHATEQSNAQIELCLADLVRQRAGIFGFSSQDQSANPQGWLVQVDQMIRWLLLQLPINPDQTTAIEVLVEERGRKDNWTMRTETLLAELRQLNSERYANVQLTIRFISKTGSPYNGYVDTVANCWGSKDQVKQKLLRHFSLLEHCLIQPADNRAYERLLLTLDGRRPLAPADWYQLLAHNAGAAEQPYTLLNQYLQKLGAHVQQQPQQWRNYLHQLQQQLASKQFSQAALEHGLLWLEQYRPPTDQLPPLLQLQLSAAQLARNNHQGRCAPQAVANAVQLASQLYEESAPQACEIVLRAAVAATNQFDFTSLQPFVEQWLAKPSASVGLLNHGKLHSTLGQLLAFQGQTEPACQHFSRAIATFTRLSDSDQRAREIQQTRTYQLIAKLSQAHPDVTQLRDELAEQLPLDQPTLLKKLANSGQPYRFQQHLLLRTLITFPDELASQRQLYLQQMEHWQMGEDHPWPLIYAYRAWLLHDSGDRQNARDNLQQAVELCEQYPNTTLQWIGCVLQVLAQRLGIAVVGDPPLADQCQQLHHSLPGAPHQALQALRQGGDILAGLNHCLPFNFH